MLAPPLTLVLAQILARMQQHQALILLLQALILALQALILALQALILALLALTPPQTQVQALMQTLIWSLPIGLTKVLLILNFKIVI